MTPRNITLLPSGNEGICQPIHARVYYTDDAGQDKSADVIVPFPVQTLSRDAPTLTAWEQLKPEAQQAIAEEALRCFERNLVAIFRNQAYKVIQFRSR
jgi:hypothetical protein